MVIETGWTYKFQFSVPFDKFDGVYTVLRIMTYAEMIADDVDLAEQLYAPVGKTPAEYDTDSATYRLGKIYKLVDPTAADVTQYIPEVLLRTTPNPNVRKYSKLVVAVNLGAFADPAQLDWVRRTLHEQLVKMVGLPKSPDTISIGTVWLTDEEYQEIEAARQTAERTTVNYFSQTIAMQQEIDRLKALVQGYEATLLALHQS